MRQINSLFVTSHMTEYKKGRQFPRSKDRQGAPVCKKLHLQAAKQLFVK